ncbi:hypothetical protein [Anaerovibrio sp. RM50]|uniref:hypothetical protein n=1 Tax=Anaerovibrio sp. RM50 TaxID=1200557 RepID=UPI000486F21A|nr:hypothetical protein [Anaerovibrio sp. RM50]
MSKDDAGFVVIDVLLLGIFLLSLAGMVKFSFLVYEDSVKMEQRFLEELARQEYIDRVEMENANYEAENREGL